MHVRGKVLARKRFVPDIGARGKGGRMRIYLVIMDETEEALVALRFAARRAAKTGGAVHIIAHVPQQDFNVFGGIQATIEAEARDRAEVVATGAAGSRHASVSISTRAIMAARGGFIAHLAWRRAGP